MSWSDQPLPANAGFFVSVLYKSNHMTSSIVPDSFSSDDLEALLETAKKEYDSTCTEQEYVEERAEEIIDLMQDMSRGPILPKLVALRVLHQLMVWHTKMGFERCERGEDSGISWLRDAGKLQSAISDLVEVHLGDDDFMSPND